MAEGTQVCCTTDRFKQKLIAFSESSVTPLFAYNATGAKHNIILSPSLLDQVAKQSSSLDEAEICKWTVLQNAFNMPKNTKSLYLELQPALSKILEHELFKGAQMEKLLSSSLSLLSESLPDLITFNSSIVDQMPWERVSGLELTNESVEAECELFSLINEFFCNAIISPITGSQFPESYQLLASDLSTFNRFYYALTMGLPRLFPLAGLPTAMLAKKRLLQNFERVFRELSDPPKKRVPDDDESMSGEETDADTPTPLTALHDFFTQHKMPIPARAAVTLKLINDLVSEVIPVASWAILHIHASASTAMAQGAVETLIDDIRKETKIWVEAIQPPSLHPSFPAPPEVSFAGVPRVVSATSFPYLRSSINEARRLYKASLMTLKVIKPITLTEAQGLRPGVQEQWEIEAGTYVDVGISQRLINNSPANFIAPNEYKPERFLDTPPPSSITSPSDLHEPLATSLIIALVAGILQLWEIKAAPKKSIFEVMQEARAEANGEKPTFSQKAGTWVIPQGDDGANVKVPRGEIRVRIKRREGLAERRTLRKGR